MTIKQYGGIFGRNPTFNNATIDGTLTVDQIVERTGAAGITLDGVTLKDGNVVLADGKGIDFSATSGTGTSELFDDYEEGTWTPTYTTDGTDFGSVTYDAVTSGNYTKIGNLVTLVARIRTDAITVGSASGNLVVGGLPFAPSTNFGSSSVYASAFAASEPRVLTPATSGILYLYKRTAADGADTIMTASEAGTGANQNTMYFTVSYQTA